MTVLQNRNVFGDDWNKEGRWEGSTDGAESGRGQIVRGLINLVVVYEVH